MLKAPRKWLAQILTMALLVMGLQAFIGMAYADSYLFWTDRATDTIKRSDLAGNGPIDIAVLNNENYTLAVDSVGMKLYWAGSVTGSIHRSNFDGSGLETVFASGLGMPREMVVDSANDKLYWIEQASGNVRRSSLNGSNVVNLVTGADVPYGLALDADHGKLYWTVGTTLGGSADAVWRSDLNGQNPQQFQLSGSDGMHGIEFSESTGKLFWGMAEPGPIGNIQQVNVDGSGFGALLTGPSESDFRHLALDEVHQRIYYDDLSSRTIKRIDYSGANIVPIVTTGDPHSLAVYIPEPSALGAMGAGVLFLRRMRHRSRATEGESNCGQ